MKNSFKTWGGKSWEDSPDYKKNAERERARRLEFKKAIEKIRKGNQMTALRFKKGGT